MLALWDTTGAEVVRKLAAERHSAGGVASGLALTLVVVVEEARVRAVEDAVTIAAASHPCRLIVVSRIAPPPGGDPADKGKDRLDAEIIVGGRLGPAEAVVLRMHGGVAQHAESVVMPLLAPDVPVVTWWHGAPPDRIDRDPLGVVAERRITDVAQAADPMAALRQRATDYAPGDTDLAWTRATPWRTLLAGAFDTVHDTVAGATVTAPPDDPTAALLAGWLCARLGVTPTLVPSGTGRIEEVAIALKDATAGDSHLTLTRREGTAALTRTGSAERILPLVTRRLGEELAEELRRLDADQPYAAALAAATGTHGLDQRPAHRKVGGRELVTA
ncbi:MAG: glucose-6-phosphate dehydrogenase assembly protein OpcA [Hamadaea sp.]|nr:glucose-6-phosphate dehydrogenase assembly protein OpcA [Hamadaea sp.]